MADSRNPNLIVLDSDLRTTDNPALDAALANGNRAIGLYVLDLEKKRPLGGASKWWLHHSLTALQKHLEKLGIPLVLRRGEKLATTKEVAREIAARGLFWNRLYDQPGVEFGSKLKEWCDENGIAHKSFNANLLHEPARQKTKAGGPFKVFTPFWKTFLEGDEPFPPSQNPEGYEPAETTNVVGASLDDWALLPENPNWAHGFPEFWAPGQDGAFKALDHFLRNGFTNYAEGRDFPAESFTSKLSPHLRFGEISPRQIWHHTKAVIGDSDRENTNKFLAEIGWREFAHHLLFHCDDLANKNFNSKFDSFGWYEGDDYHAHLTAWQKGQTGYPLVDAGMRELWQTGWMHNRVRMVVGSFLVKHLLIDWRDGEKWFWDTLVDACPANNTASWQWIAGCGADAAPYFRIFNPVTQSEKFDPAGKYIRRYVPELAKLPDKLIHKPWTARKEELALCGVELGKNYPHPIVDHGFARERALNAFNDMKQHAA